MFNFLKNSLKKSNDKIKSAIENLRYHSKLDEDFLEELEETLISCDIGVDVSRKVVKTISNSKFDIRLDIAELKTEIAMIVANDLSKTQGELVSKFSKKPHVVLIAGVNGSGKTTSIAKLANFWLKENKVMVIAADSFRAAAVKQLKIWADKLGVIFFQKEEIADPAAIVYEGLKQSIGNDVDIVIIDTAGRQPTRSDLMAELAKINRVVAKVFGDDFVYDRYLVLDATVGQNAYNQVDGFNKELNLSGLIVTKLDGTAKGGVIIGIIDKFKIPVVAVGVGEKIEDITQFESKEFALSLLN